MLLFCNPVEIYVSESESESETGTVVATGMVVATGEAEAFVQRLLDSGRQDVHRRPATLY